MPRVVDNVTAAVDELSPAQPVLLVAHSNAGLFVPLLVSSALRPVRGCLFVDAALPAKQGSTAVAPEELVEFLRAKASDGRLPPWTRWWDEEEIASMFPDPQTRAAVSAEQPRLPLSYYFSNGSDLSVHSAADLDWVAQELNDRPLKRLGFRKPIEQIGELLLR